MAWQAGYLQASLRNVEFHVKRATGRLGRRGIEHVFPGQDVTEFEDLGGFTKKFNLDCYIVGKDYFEQRDRFEAEINKGGTGLLVHPYRGTAIVQVCGEASVVETDDEGGVARYSIPFLVVENVSATKSTKNTPWIVRSTKDATIASVKEHFLDVFDLAGKPAAAVHDARLAMDSALSVVDSAKQIANSAADFKREVEDTRGRLQALALNLEYIVDTFASLIDWGADELTDPRSEWRELKQIASFGTAIIGDNNRFTDEDYPATQFQRFVEQIAVACQAGFVIETQFTTLDDVEEVRGEFFQSIALVLGRTSIGDDVYSQFQDLRSAVYEDLGARSLDLPRLLEYNLAAPETTLSFLYSLYGDLDEEENFILLNEIVHPGFIPANVPIKVLIRETR